jgi:hypothetical protein
MSFFFVSFRSLKTMKLLLIWWQIWQNIFIFLFFFVAEKFWQKCVIIVIKMPRHRHKDNGLRFDFSLEDGLRLPNRFELGYLKKLC